MRMKSTGKKLLLLLFVLTMTFFGCRNQPDDRTVKKYRFSDLEEGCVALNRGEDVIYPYENRIWSGGETVPLGWYDCADEMRFHEVSELRVSALTVSEDSIFLCTAPAEKEQEIVELTKDGEVQNRWPIPAELDTVRRDYRIAAGDSWILLVYTSAKEGETEQILSSVSVSRSLGTVTQRRMTGGKTAADLMGEKPESEVFLRTQEMPNSVLAMEWMGGSEFLIDTLYSDLFGSLYGELYTYDAARGTMKYCRGTENHLLGDMADGQVYGLCVPSSAWISFCMWTEDGQKALRTVGIDKGLARISDELGTKEEVLSFTDVYFTGYDFLLWNARSGTLCVFDAVTENGSCLTVLYPVSEKGTDDYDSRVQIGGIPFASSWFEEQQDCIVQSITYLVSEFPDRLRMKLLAGDTDFDVIWADKCSRGDLLSAILRYGLYLPLEESPEVLRNMEAFADGVQDYMTRDGHIFGCPIDFGGNAYLVGKDFAETGLPVPDSDWTLDDFWRLCEEAEPFCHDGTALAPLAQIWILEAVAESGVRRGSVDLEALTGTMECLMDYHSRGVLQDYSEASRFLLDEIPVPAHSYYWMDVATDAEYAAVIPYPAVDEKRYAALESFLFINPMTTKPELSLAYLAMMTGSDFAPFLAGEKALYMKEADSYFTWAFGDGWTPGYEKYRWTKEPFTLEGSSVLAAEVTGEVFPGTEVCFCDSEDLRMTIRELTERLFAGDVSPSEAAKEFTGYINYHYFE